MKQCEICGHKRPDDSTVVTTYPDGIKRCTICVHRAAHGRYIPRREIDAANIQQITIWSKELSDWIGRLANDR